MHTHTSSLIARITSALVGLTLVMTALLVGPAPRAQADSAATLFRGEFDAAPIGPLSLSTPLAVETGSVVAQAGSVAIASAPSGRALKLDGTAGQATALAQWSNFPGALPAHSNGTMTVQITGDFTTSISTTLGASVSLITGTTTFELFSFGPNGALTRGGSPIGLSYAVSSTVGLDARLILKPNGNSAQILLKSGNAVQTISVALPSAFTRDTLSALRLQAPSGTSATADHMVVMLLPGQSQVEKPPVIVIHDSDIEQEIERIGGNLFVNIKITIVNTGGRSSGTFLVLNLADFNADFDLADVSFLIGGGYVKEINGQQVVIGLGENNVIRGGDKVKVKIKFKAKHGELQMKVNAHFSLKFGSRSLTFQPIVSITPVSGTTPISGTTPMSGTTPISGTSPISLPATLIIQRLPLSAIDVRFVGTWRSRGGLDIFGLPVTGPITQPSGIIVQYFERARLEYHPELAGTRYAVLLGLLGVELGYSAPVTTTAVPTNSAELVWYFPATKHLIGKQFRSFWQNRGGLLIFGLPIGEAVTENGRLVQYFERARFELHPELAGTAYEVQLGHLGVLSLEAANR